jgi:hypothetical protein
MKGCLIDNIVSSMCPCALVMEKLTIFGWSKFPLRLLLGNTLAKNISTRQAPCILVLVNNEKLMPISYGPHKQVYLFILLESLNRTVIAWTFVNKLLFGCGTI